MKKSLIAKLLSILLKVMVVGGIIGLFFVPYLYDLLFNINFSHNTISYKIAFYLCSISSLLILFELIRIFDIVYNGSPFKKEIVNALKVIAVIFMIISIVVIIKTIFITTVLSIGISIFAFVTSLCFYVLSQIFKVAVEYKNEIDYTV